MIDVGSGQGNNSNISTNTNKVQEKAPELTNNDKVNDKNRKTMENLLKDGKKADIVKLMKFAMSKVNAEYVPEEFEEEFELDEEKGPRQLVNPNKEVFVNSAIKKSVKAADK